MTKGPYVLDFIDIAENAHERELESALVREIPRFLRELGVGFAYYGRQQPLEIGGQEFFSISSSTTTSCADSSSST